MTVEFDRPVGASADVAELEYIAALMQTEKLFLRQEGSLTANDIHFFLKSRYGLRVSVEEIERLIMIELGGATASTPPPSSAAFGAVADNDTTNNNINGNSLRQQPQEQQESTVGVSKVDVSSSQNYLADFVVDTPADQDDIEVAASPTATATATTNTNTTIKPRELAASQKKVVQSRPTPTISSHRVSLKMNALRLSQQFSQEDYEKFLHYKAMKKASTTNSIPGGGALGPAAGEVVEDIAAAGPTTDLIPAADDDDGELKIDLSQIASLLLIPKLREIRQESDHSKSKNTTENIEKEIGPSGSDYDIIDLFLNIIIQESGLEYGEEITNDALAEILHLGAIPSDWGEIVNIMMKSVRDASDGNPPLLNRETLLRVLTDDILAYNIDIRNCTKETAIQEVNEIELTPDDNKNKNNNNIPRNLDRIFTASNIDTNADTYRSCTWQILAWYAIVVVLFTYSFQGPFPIYLWEEPPCNKVGHLFCAIGTSAQNWLELLLRMTIIGFPLYYLATFGNSIFYSRSHFRLTLVAIVVVAFFTYAPYFYRADWGVFHSGPTQEQVESGEHQDNNRWIIGPIALTTGSILIVIQLVQIIPWRKKGHVSHRLRSAVEMKCAAVRKVDRAVANAVKCHLLEEHQQQGSRHSGGGNNNTSGRKGTTNNLRPLSSTIVKYQQTFAETEKVGGILWTLRKIRDRSLFYEEGIWLWPRLLASNFAQWFTVLICIGFALFAIHTLSSEEQVWPEVMSNDKLTIVAVVGFPPALFVSFYISLVYVPSTMTSVLKYRSGVYGSLRDRRFLQNRFAMDSANLLFGAAFWTCLYSAGLFYALTSLFVFLCMWTETQQRMISLVANLCGMLITVIVKQLIMLFIRSRWSRGYYRSRPAVVNVSNTIQEVWNLGLTTFTAIVRGFKFLAIFLLYLGRIDGEVFAPGVGWFMDSIPLDGLPHCFFRDLLIHDAHRHPLIERLGFLYMMKLRLGSSFGTQGGALWRILFTCSLMPWLRKYCQHLGICGEDNRKAKKAGLSGLSKEALVDNLVALDEQYKDLAAKVKNLGLGSGNLGLGQLTGSGHVRSGKDGEEMEDNPGRISTFWRG